MTGVSPSPVGTKGEYHKCDQRDKSVKPILKVIDKLINRRKVFQKFIMKISLIYPPFATCLGVHLAIPLLTGYLRSKGINVSAWDANIDFWNYMLLPEKVKSGRDYMENRFLQLNGKRKLSSIEQVEYNHFISVLKVAEDFSDDFLDILFSGEKYRAPVQLENIPHKLGVALSFAAAPAYPEKFTFTDTDYKYFGIGSSYSTSDIIDSLEKDSVFYNFYSDHVHGFIEKENPQVVGISVTFEGNVISAFCCANIIKKIAPHIHITLGGSFISATMHKLKNRRLFDIVDSMIIDDGEVPLECLVKELSNIKPDLSKIPGIIYRKNSRIKVIPPAKPLDIDSLPPPDYSSIPFDKYPIRKEIIGLSFRTSRGCHWRKCIFCPHELKIICHRQQADAEYVFECLKHINEQTGMFIFGFVEEASDPAVIEKLANLIIKKKRFFFWGTNLRLHKNITLDRCMLFKESGCFTLNFGIETYNDRLLKYIGKGLNTKTINYALSNIAWSGIRSHAYMMVGLPTETEQEARKSYEFILELKKKNLLNSHAYSALELLPGSDIYNNPEKYGIRIKPSNSKDDLPSPQITFEGTPISQSRASRLADEFGDPKGNPYIRHINKTQIIVKGRQIDIRHKA